METYVGMAEINQNDAGFGAGDRPNKGNAKGDVVDNTQEHNPVAGLVGRVKELWQSTYRFFYRPRNNTPEF